MKLIILVDSDSQPLVDSISLINSLEDQRFIILLNKLSAFHFSKKNIPFSNEDKEKLKTAFGLANDSEVDVIIDTCISIFKQAVYHAISTSTFKKELYELGFIEEKIIAMSSVWKAKSKDLIADAKSQSIIPKNLSTIDWSLNLNMATSKLSSGKYVQPRAVMTFGLESAHEDSSQTKENITLEFNHSELYDFFNQLETIQKQLDAFFT